MAKVNWAGWPGWSFCGTVLKSMWYSVASGILSVSFMPQRGHTPGVLERTSGSMGQTQTWSCDRRSTVVANIASDDAKKDRLFTS